MIIKRCEKCKCELPSNYTKKLCRSCSARKKEKAEKGLAIAGGIAAGVLALLGSIVGIKGNIKKFK